MIQRSCLAGLLLLAACGGKAAPASPTPAPTADRVVQDFMRAVADSNIVRMSQLWGSARGPSAQTHEPADYERRVVVIQAYLRGAAYRILSDNAMTADPSRRTLQVELKREKCVKIIPFTVIRDGSGWLVNQIDLGAAGTPGRPCEQS